VYLAWQVKSPRGEASALQYSEVREHDFAGNPSKWPVNAIPSPVAAHRHESCLHK
jgi:hypothetical protein